MLQPFSVADAVLEQYRRYVRTGFPLRDPDLERQRDDLIDTEGLLWTEPFVSLSRPGAGGPSLADLSGDLLDQTVALPWGFERLYAHQEAAIHRLRPSRPGGPASTLVLSGTGSGKTESFLIPIVDACLRSDGPGVKAVLMYPMNALANDQLKRLRDLLFETPEVTFGRYTGDAPETDAGSGRQQARPADAPENLIWSREAMRENPPDILITNYLQLELLLLRGRDRELFAYGAPEYLVVDEIHLFGGILGSEVAALLRRFRQHVGATPDELTVVGTSATAGSDAEREELLKFARRFFGVQIADDALVEEQPLDPPPPGPETPPLPHISDELLANATTDEGLIALGAGVLGLELEGVGDELRLALGNEIDRFAALSSVEGALLRPGSLQGAAESLRDLNGRAEASAEELRREAEAIVLLGSAALQPALGEPDPAPRLRPRVHQVVRSLAGLNRCLGEDCGRLLPPGATRCDECNSRALPLASCRTCGEAYWHAPTGAERQLLPLEPQRDMPKRFLSDADAEGRFDDEDGEEHSWDEIVVCSGCAAWTDDAAALDHAPDCPTPESAGRSLRTSEDGKACPACGAKGGGGREVLTGQRGSGAASVAVLTQVLGDRLREDHGEAEGRLLLFTDSRQDAGQQAGYADDQGARVTVRQLITDALERSHGGHLDLPELIRKVRGQVLDSTEQTRRWLIGESGEGFLERAEDNFIPSGNDRSALGRQLEWEVVLELTERARRRFSLEAQGLLVVGIDQLDVIVDTVEGSWRDHPFGSTERLKEIVAAFGDVFRFARAVDHPFLTLKPSALRDNHGIRIGDRAVSATRGFAERPFSSPRDEVDIKRLWSPRGDTRLAKLLGRVLSTGARSEELREVLERFMRELERTGFIVKRRADARQRYMAAASRFVPATPGELLRCPRCGTVRGHPLTSVAGDEPLCLMHNCRGRPESWEPVEGRDFYRSQYQADPRRLIVREHSGQIEADMRLALEQAFNRTDPVSVDVLACTPTLEVGVSLDDLNAVVLRNLPPSPANYAQRVGRAGRRSKVALAVAHAGNAPHDSYFFDQPGELIAGEVRAPSISMENEPLLRRHMNSLILETLGLDLPAQWLPDRYDEETESIADEEGTVREAVIDRYREALSDDTTRRRVIEAINGAFASSEDPAPPLGIDDARDEQIDRFPEKLRAALMRWSDRYKAVEAELVDLERIRRKTDAEIKARNRLEEELRRTSEPSSPDQLPLGFLGLVGFLPKYGATGERALLVTPRSDAPIDQAAHVAVTEFAPGNAVYARGRRLKVTRLHPRPVEDVAAAAEFRENVVKEGRRCDHCGTFTTDPLARACPDCEDDLLEQRAVVLTGVRASGSAISSDDEYRTRAAYAVQHSLGPEVDKSIAEVGGLSFERSRGREITIANRGLIDKDGGEPIGFAVCTECGFAEEDPGHDDRDDKDAETEHRGHSFRCPARRDPNSDVVLRGTWLIAQLKGDVLEIPLAPGQEDPGLLAWRKTLPEALMLGMRETMQAGRRDLETFELISNEQPRALVIYDTMPGGTGYMPKLFHEENAGLREAARVALERLEGCDCERSCHRCLRDFWNQRVHGALDRHAVIPTLRQLTVLDITELDPTPDERLASFLEREFFSRLVEAGLPVPTLQNIHRLSDGRITVADARYADPDISIYLDGRAYHAQSVEKIASDVRKRNDLERDRQLLLEFTYADVMDRFDEVVESLKRALARDGDAGSELGDIPTDLSVLAQDEESRLLTVQVDADAWVRDEAAREAALAASNQARLAGWRLDRQVTKRDG